MTSQQADFKLGSNSRRDLLDFCGVYTQDRHTDSNKSGAVFTSAGPLNSHKHETLNTPLLNASLFKVYFIKHRTAQRIMQPVKCFYVFCSQLMSQQPLLAQKSRTSTSSVDMPSVCLLC